MIVDATTHRINRILAAKGFAKIFESFEFFRVPVPQALLEFFVTLTAPCQRHRFPLS